jgi:hypothetical protein
MLDILILNLVEADVGFGSSEEKTYLVNGIE